MNEIATRVISIALIGMLMLSALAVTAMPSAAAEAPVLPTSFYGNVTVNGVSAPVNTTVTGRIVNAAGSPGNGTITVTEAGKYGGSGGFDPKLHVYTDNIDDIGNTIEFYVQLPSWAESRKANENATLDSDTHNLDLTVTTAGIYNLTISSTAGGNVTTPGEGTFTYNASEVVTLIAAVDTNYSFVNWTGDVGTIAAVNSTTTNITMSGNYSITANFAAAATNATLEGHVNFSGRGTAPNSTWAEPFNVTLFEAGNLSHVIWTGNATTNNTGVFTISGLTAGTYDIGIKNWTCLSELNTSVTLTAGNTTVVDFGTTREGDANNDDYINILDASSLVPCYGSSTGDPSWNEHCDFNRDGNINILDASALASNYGKHGDLV